MSTLPVSNPLVTAAQQAASQLSSRLSSFGGGAAGGLTEGVKDRLNQLQNVKLAETFLTTGPLDEFMTVDVLGVSDANILNTLAGKLSGMSGMGLESLRSSPSNLLGNALGLISSNGNGGFSFDTKALTDRVLSSLGGGQGIMRELSSGLQSTLTQGFNIDPNLYSQVTGIIGGVTTNFQSGNFNDARGIFDLVGQITGDSQLAQFFDVGAEANLLSGIFNEAIRLGIPAAIDVLLENADSDEAAYYALRGNLDSAIYYSDLPTCATIINKVGPNQVLADAPAMAQQLIATYKMPAGTTRAQYGTRYTELKSVLDSIKPGWGKVNRGGTLVTDLGMFAQASADAVLVLSTEAEWQDAVKIAPFYKSENLKENIKRKYPYVVF